MGYAEDHAGYAIDTEDQARAWVRELVAGVELVRLKCDVVYPGDKTRTARDQQKAYRQFLVKHGAALGAVMALHRAGSLGDVAYESLRQQVVATLQPTVVG